MQVEPLGLACYEGHLLPACQSLVPPCCHPEFPMVPHWPFSKWSMWASRRDQEVVHASHRDWLICHYSHYTGLLLYRVAWVTLNSFALGFKNTRVLPIRKLFSCLSSTWLFILLATEILISITANTHTEVTAMHTVQAKGLEVAHCIWETESPQYRWEQEQ